MQRRCFEIALVPRVSGHECEKMLHLIKSTCRRVSVELKRSLERPRCAEQAGEDGMSIASRQVVEVVEAGTVIRNRSCSQSVRARVCEKCFTS
jgi:hypothetical protein